MSPAERIESLFESVSSLTLALARRRSPAAPLRLLTKPPPVAFASSRGTTYRRRAPRPRPRLFSATPRHRTCPISQGGTSSPSAASARRKASAGRRTLPAAGMRPRKRGTPRSAGTPTGGLFPVSPALAGCWPARTCSPTAHPPRAALVRSRNRSTAPCARPLPVNIASSALGIVGDRTFACDHCSAESCHICCVRCVRCARRGVGSSVAGDAINTSLVHSTC